MMARIELLLALWCGVALPAAAQDFGNTTGYAITTCGSPPVAYVPSTSSVARPGPFAIDANGNLCVNVGPNGIVVEPQPVATSPVAVAPTAGAFSSILAASATRKGCLIQNVGTTLGYVYFGANGSATTSNTFQIAANGGTINCADNATIDQSNVSATCASGTCAFIVKAE